MIMGRNGGVRQHQTEIALDGYNWNPLGLQKWHQIFEGVISPSCVQMVVQHRDPDALDGNGPGRRGRQTLGIP